MHLSEGVPLELGHERGVPLSNLLILLLSAGIACKQLQIGTDMLLIITSTGDKLHKNFNIADLE